MKKLIAMFMSIMIITICFAGCNNNTTVAPIKENDKLSIVATIFPAYDFARQVSGDNAEITMLLPPGAESHSYEPSARDIIKIQNCDLFIYTGGESDAWVDGILESMDKPVRTLKMIDLVSVVEEDIVEGMQEEEEDHSHDGIFEDSEVKDRTLSDWAGDWKSVLPYLEDGTLDEGLKHKAENDEEKTYEEYKEYYTVGYQTDYDRIVITDDSFTFYTGDNEYTANYEYKGFVIMTYESGKKGVRYQFEAVGDSNGAPKYIQFSDHNIKPAEDLNHYHIYYGNESFEKMLSELDNWPTYYLSDMTAEEIAEDFKGHSHEEAYDEHVWTSPKNAIQITEGISTVLCEIDQTNSETYKTNTATYVEKLNKLDKDFTDFFATVQNKTLIFGDRFPFRYFFDAYGLSYSAAFPGCSTDSEASAGTVAYLIDKVKADNISTVFYIEFSNHLMADSIAESTNTKTALLHSGHNVSKTDMDKGATYVSIMEQNLATLKEAMK